jgi:hypothetical protein
MRVAPPPMNDCAKLIAKAGFLKRVLAAAFMYIELTTLAPRFW